MIKFHKFASSSQGSKYFEKGWACQDNSGTLDFQDIQVIAVADGHGSSDCFRSKIGSKLAIDVLFEQIKIFFRDNLENSERFSDTGIKNFKFDFVQKWRAAVKKDWNEKLVDGKIDETEIRYKTVSDKYKARYGSENPEVVENYLYKAYGTTLICAISIGIQILILQIGDGTCVILRSDGKFTVPVPTSDENFLNVTTSLCENQAELKIRHVILNCDKNNPNYPVAIFLSTDGLDNCYPYYHNEEHLYKLYGIIIENMLEFGYDATDSEIDAELLASMTKKGSQDDISLAYFAAEDIKMLEDAYSKIDATYKPSKVGAEINQSPKVDTEINQSPKVDTEINQSPKVDTEINQSQEISTAEEKIAEPTLQPPNFRLNSNAKIIKASEIIYSSTPVQIPSNLNHD